MVGRNYRAPGIYEERREQREVRSVTFESGVPAFLGLAYRGPLDVPVKIDSFDEYKRVFGPPVNGSFMPDSVYGFFANGGKTCYIIRIAHRRGAGKEEKATKASLEIPDSAGRPTLLIEAANEGSWGNEIKIQIKSPEEKIQTYITFDLEAGQKKAQVKSARGFERGCLVRVFNRKQEFYGTLVEVEAKGLRFRDSDVVPETFKSSDLTYIEPIEFELHITEGGRREVYKGLSMAPGSERYPERVMEESSSLIRITVLDNEGSLSESAPLNMGPINLSGGLDGFEVITPEDFIGLNEGPGYRNGLRALEANEDIDLIAAPDLMACQMMGLGFTSKRDVEAVQEAILNQCELLKDRFAILDIMPSSSPDDALSWRLRFDSDFGAFYYPWIGVASKDGPRMIPPSGHICGVISRCDREEGPHRAAANEAIQGAILVERNLDEEAIGYLNENQLNPIRIVPSRGIRIWGARTVSSRRDWRYIPVRRVFNMIRRSVYNNTQWVVFEPNEQSLWNKLERQLKFYLASLFERGFFAGESPSDAFYVRCDAETNSPERRAAGELVAEIGIAPVRPAEFLTFVLEQQLPESSG